MRVAIKATAGFMIVTLAAAFSGGAQQKPPSQDTKPMPAGMAIQDQMHHHHGDVPLVTPAYPRMGRAQELAGAQIVTLEQVEKIAAESNPTLRQAEIEIDRKSVV